MPTVSAPGVSVVPAAASLFQTGTGRSAVTGLPLDLAHTHPKRWRAGHGTAAPKAPFTHFAVLGWMPEERGRKQIDKAHLHSAGANA